MGYKVVDAEFTGANSMQVVVQNENDGTYAIVDNVLSVGVWQRRADRVVSIPEHTSAPEWLTPDDVSTILAEGEKIAAAK